MIKSKNKTFGFWITPIMIGIVIGISLLIFLKDPIEKDVHICGIWDFIMLALLLPQFWVTSRSVIINTDDETITFSHFFIKQTSTYKFTNIDGYVDWLETPSRGRPYKVIYLVKDERFIERISGLIYSNVDELETGLKTAKYLGPQKYSYFKKIKILFGRKVLDD